MEVVEGGGWGGRRREGQAEVVEGGRGRRRGEGQAEVGKGGGQRGGGKVGGRRLVVTGEGEGMVAVGLVGGGGMVGEGRGKHRREGDGVDGEVVGRGGGRWKARGARAREGQRGWKAQPVVVGRGRRMAAGVVVGKAVEGRGAQGRGWGRTKRGRCKRSQQDEMVQVTAQRSQCRHQSHWLPRHHAPDQHFQTQAQAGPTGYMHPRWLHLHL